MRITENRVVGIEYTLTDDDGQVLETSEGCEPLCYLHGADAIAPGLEKELEGKEVGDQLQVAITPEEGYGHRDEELQQQVDRDQFEEVEDLEVGMQFQVDSDGGPLLVTVIDVADDMVTVDANHPLAGVNLNFAVTVARSARRDCRRAGTWARTWSRWPRTLERTKKAFDAQSEASKASEKSRKSD